MPTRTTPPADRLPDLALLGYLGLAGRVASAFALDQDQRRLARYLGMTPLAHEGEVREWLKAAGLKADWRGIVLSEATGTRAFCEAVEAGLGGALVGAYLEQHGTRRLRGAETDVLSLRLAVLVDDVESVRWLGEQGLPRTAPPFRKVELLLAAFPGISFTLVEHLSWELVAMLGEAWLHGQWMNWIPLAPLGEALERALERHPRPEMARLVAEVRVRRGDLAGAQAVMAPYGGLDPALEGTFHALEGRWAEALPRLEAAWEAQKARNRRVRHVLLPGVLGWMHVLTLIASGQAERAETLARIHGGRDFPDKTAQVWDALLDAARLAHAGTLGASALQDMRALQGGSFLRFLCLLLRFWEVGRERLEVPTWLGDLSRAAQESGMPALAGHTRALVARVKGEAAASPWVDLFQATPPWARTLEALLRLGDRGKTPEEPVRARRWTWTLVEGRYGDGQRVWSLEVREHRRDPKGAWSKGREVPLHRLREELHRGEALPMQDHRAVAVLDEAGGYGFVTRDVVDQVALALVGHDGVFVDLSVDKGRARMPVTVGAQAPRLEVVRDRDLYRLCLVPFPGVDAAISCDGVGQVLVTHWEARHLELAGLLGPEGLEVPAEAQAQVVEAASHLANLVAVHSEVALEGEGGGASVLAGDLRPEVSLVPAGEGLVMRLRSRPAPGTQAFLPGTGPAEVLTQVEGQPRRVVRDLAGEVAAAARVQRACGLPRHAWELCVDTVDEALDLLVQLEPLREGLHLLWPEGGRLETPRVGRPEAFRIRLQGGGPWFELTGELNLGEGETLAVEALLKRLGEARGAYVPLDEGRWLKLERHFREKLEALRTLAVPQGKALGLGLTAALALEDLQGDLVEAKASRPWRQQVKALQAALHGVPSVPATFQAELRPYQEDGFRWLARLAQAGIGACLADDMGLGKTLQALALLVHRAAEGPALVVAPTSVVGNWVQEARRFAPTLRLAGYGEGNRDVMLADAGAFDVVVASYGLLVQDEAAFQARTWATVILDESQAVKNAGTRRFQAVVGLQAQARVALSGTPLENHLGELWALFRFLNPGLLGDGTHFQACFAGPIERDDNRDALARLRRTLRPFLLRRTKQEVLQELPPLTEIVHEVELSSRERTLLEALRRDALARVEGQGAIAVLAELMRLRRACCHPRLVDPDFPAEASKLTAFLEIVAELRENRHRALVFSQFVDHLTLVREVLDAEGIAYQYLDGATPAAARRTRIDAFQAGKGDLFLISLKAGGTGLNLTAADYVIHLDPWWNPAAEDQASARAHRMGQDRPVTVYRLVAKDTLESRILDLHHRKRSLVDGVLQGSAAAGTLSTEELIALLKN